MRIRLEIKTPFRFMIEEGAPYLPMVVESGPHNVTVLPPIADPIVPTDRPQKSFEADTLVVEVDAEDVNADDIKVPSEALYSNKNLDPLIDKAFEWANWFLMRYRDYTQAYFIQLVVRSQTRYGISYPVHGSTTSERVFPQKILTACLSPETWEGIANLDRVYDTPRGIELLLDAQFAAHAGAGVVLAWAALEMVIDRALEVLVKHSQVPSDLWNWLTTRNNYWQQPSTGDQYTVLLEAVGGRSLKNETALWQNFQELKTLRNQVAHGGELRLNRKPVPEERIKLLIRSVRDIVTFVNKQLPPQSQWRMFPEYKGAYGAVVGYASLRVGPQHAPRQ